MTTRNDRPPRPAATLEDLVAADPEKVRHGTGDHQCGTGRGDSIARDHFRAARISHAPCRPFLVSVGQAGGSPGTAGAPATSGAPGTADEARSWRAYLELAAVAGAVPQARHFVRGALARWGLSHAADDTELIASELVTNAISASAALPFLAGVGLLIAASPGRLTVLVWDASQEQPVRPDPDDDAVTGRGLAIVAALSAGWGWVPDVRGKVVWATVDLDGP